MDSDDTGLVVDHHNRMDDSREFLPSDRFVRLCLYVHADHYRDLGTRKDALRPHLSARLADRQDRQSRQPRIETPEAICEEMVSSAGVGGDDGQLYRDADLCHPAGDRNLRVLGADLHGDRDRTGDPQRHPVYPAPVVHDLPDGVHLGKSQRSEEKAVKSLSNFDQSLFVKRKNV